MAAGRLIVPGWMPALDENGNPIPNARVFFYLNKTTTLAAVFSDEAMTVPLVNPVPSNASGRFPAVWADDSVLYSASVDAPYGPSGIPFTYDDLSASMAADILVAGAAEAAADEAQQTLVEIQGIIDAAMQAGGGEAAVAGAIAGADAAQAVVATKLDKLSALSEVAGLASLAGQVSVQYRSSPGDGYAGTFEWIPGNQSANVSTDTLQGVWVAPSTDPTGASGAWKRLYQGFVNVRWFGAKGDAVIQSDNTLVSGTDDTAALKAAFASGADTIYFPRGNYLCTEQLVATRPTVVAGDGQLASRIRWRSTSTSEGIRINSSDRRKSMVRGLSIETEKVAVGVGITFDYSGCVSGGTILPRAASHARVEDCRIQGAVFYTVDGWDKGVEFISCLNPSVGGGTRILGVYTGAYGSMPNSSTGIAFSGAGSPVSLVVDNGTYISAFKWAIDTQDCEGIYVAPGCEFVTVGGAIRTRNAVAESGLWMGGCHIATVGMAFDLENMADWMLVQNNIYNVADATPLTYFRIGPGCKNGRIGGNILRRLGTTSIITGIVIEAGASDIVIDPNQFDIGASGAPIIDAGTRTYVREQDYVSAPSGTQITSTSTTSTFEVRRGYTGDLNAIVTDWRRTRQLHVLGTGVTNAPAAWTNTAGAIVETVAIDPNTSYQVGRHPNLTATVSSRRKVSGTWGAWV